MSVIHRPSTDPHKSRRRAAPLAACIALLCALSLGACGSSSVSDAVPKRTPDITPPTDTAAEKAAVQTTSTSTTSTKKTTGTTGTTGESAGGTESKESEAGKEAGGETGASGGAASEEKEKTPEATSKGGGESAGGSSPTGGASAP